MEVLKLLKFGRQEFRGYRRNYRDNTAFSPVETPKWRVVLASQCLLHRNLPIIEVADPKLLEELMLDRQLSALVLARLSDQVALIDPSRFDVFVARLRKIGHLPKVEA